MKSMLLAAGIGMLVTASSAFASGSFTCEIDPDADEIGFDTLIAQLEDEGWEVRRYKMDGGCYEVYGTPPGGTFAEYYFHPENGSLQQVNRFGNILAEAEDGTTSTSITLDDVN